MRPGPRTVYVKPEHRAIWAHATDLAERTGISLSTIVTWALYDLLISLGAEADKALRERLMQ